jgi:hypothetical protein
LCLRAGLGHPGLWDLDYTQGPGRIAAGLSAAGQRLIRTARLSVLALPPASDILMRMLARTLLRLASARRAALSAFLGILSLSVARPPWGICLSDYMPAV